MDIGAHLRSSREAQGMSLALLARKTRVPQRILAAIEINDLPSIPPKPYGRGFVRSYAGEVGLDPDQTVRAYFGQFSHTVPVVTEAAPRRIQIQSRPSAWLLTAGALTMTALGSLVILGSDPAIGDESNGDAAVGTSGTSPAPANEPRGSAAPRPVGSAAVTTASSEPDADLTVLVYAERTSWVAATADGKRVIYQLMDEGSQRTVRAAHEVTLRIGDAAAIRLTVNGRDAGVLGISGEVRNARITPATAPSFGIARDQGRR